MSDETKSAAWWDEEKVFGPQRRRRMWAFVMWIIALSLWVQWLGAGAAAEFRSEDGSVAVLMLQGLPLLAVVVATSWARAAGRMALVPLSFLPGLVMMPEAEWEALSAPLPLGLSTATFALYLVVAARGPTGSSQTAGERRRAQGGLPDRFADHFRRFVVVRCVVMAVIFAVITHGLFFAPATQEALAAVPEASTSRLQHVFAVILMYFAWLVAVYVGALLPALNWEHDRRNSGVPRRLWHLLGDHRRLKRRVGGWVVSLSVVIVAAAWLLY